MANNKVDLNFKASESLGDFLPTLYLDFVDVSYGQTSEEGAIDEEVPAYEYARYNTDPKLGTAINGSFSIYFTKDPSEPAEDLATWVRDNFGDLYVYLWLSPYQLINNQLEQGAINIKDIFHIMEPINRAGFTSAHPSYEAIITEMKDAFLNDTWWDASAWRTVDGASGGDECGEITDDGCVIKESDIDIPGKVAYTRFWGSTMNPSNTLGEDQTKGPWNYGTPPASQDEKISEHWGFMRSYLWKTLLSYNGVDGSSLTYSHGRRFSATKLSDLILEDGSNVLSTALNDEAGGQLSVIMNIPIDFVVSHNYSTEAEDVVGADARLSNADSIYIIGTVGRPVLGDDISESNVFPGTLDDSFEAMNTLLFNANFGDITYEKIFSSGGVRQSELTIADQETEIFVYVSNNAPHAGSPIMSINGTYHADTPVGREKVIRTMSQLIKKYSPFIETSRPIRQNIANLAKILSHKGYSVDILRRLQMLRKTIVNKSTATEAGKFYEAYKRLLYELNRTVLRQPKLKKIKVYNNKVIDSRMNAPNVSYVPASSGGNCAAGTVDVGDSSKCRAYASMGIPAEPSDVDSVDSAYIPKLWSHMARRSIHTIPINGRQLLGELAQFALEEGAPMIQVGDESYSFEEGTSADMATDLQNYVTQDDEDSAWLSYYDQFQNNRLSGIVGPSTDSTDGDPTATGFTDTVVENSGVFFFDYEKALGSHSKLSLVLAPWKILRYLGLHVPWDFYRVTEVKMTRSEARLLTSMGEEFLESYTEDDLESVVITQTLHFDEVQRYPVPAWTKYEGFQSTSGTEVLYRYGQPSVRLATSTALTEAVTIADNSAAIYNYAADSTYESIEEGTPLAGSMASEATYGPLDGTMTSGDSYLLFDTVLNKYVEPDSTKEQKSYIKFINFEFPEGVRSTTQPDMSLTSGDHYTRPSGRLSNYEGWVVRGGYRLMAFEYKDYMDDDVAYYNTVGINEFLERTDGSTLTDAAMAYAEDRVNTPTYYDVSIKVEDRSLKMLDVVHDYFDSAYDDFIKFYYNPAIASCSYNNINDQFNDFFTNGINEAYPTGFDRQWIKAPYMLNLARQLFFNTYGTGTFTDDDTTTETEQIFKAIEKESLKISKLIGPDDGRLIHLNKFKIDFEKILNIIKPRVDSPTTTISGRRLFGSKDGEHMHQDVTGLPYFNYHPIYDRAMIVSNVSDTDGAVDYSTDEMISTNWTAMLDHVGHYDFKNVFPISEPIYGDMFLSSIYEWEYEPPNFVLEFGELFSWLENLIWVLDPTGARGVDGSSGLYGEVGFYDNRGVATDVKAPTTGTGCMYPPGRKQIGAEEWSADEVMWRAWIDQMMVCCFLYRFGPLVAAGMGVSYTDPESDGVGAESIFSPGGGADAPFLSSKTMYDIIEYIVSQYVDINGGTATAARATLTGISALENGYEAMISTVNSSVLYNGRKRLFDGRTDGSGGIWNANFFHAVKNIMKPELCTMHQARPEGYTGSSLISAMRPRVFYTNMNFKSDGYSSTAMWRVHNPIIDSDGSIGSWYCTLYVPTDLSYASNGGFMASAGWVKQGAWDFVRASGEVITAEWNEDRLSNFVRREPDGASYRFPTGYQRPEETSVPAESPDPTGEIIEGVDEVSMDCVIATHALSSGMFKPEDRANAVDWCVKSLHGKWWGEIMRRGYRYLGRKHIANGTAELVYDEFKECLEWANGKRPFEMRVASRYIYRVIQTFIVGMFVKENK